jgi:hypothetical protein
MMSLVAERTRHHDPGGHVLYFVPSLSCTLPKKSVEGDDPGLADVMLEAAA